MRRVLLTIAIVLVVMVSVGPNLGGSSVAAADYRGNTCLNTQDCWVYYSDCSLVGSISAGMTLRVFGPGRVIGRWEVLVTDRDGTWVDYPRVATFSAPGTSYTYTFDPTTASPLYAFLGRGSGRCALHLYTDPATPGVTFSEAGAVIRTWEGTLPGPQPSGEPRPSAIPSANLSPSPSPSASATAGTHWECTHGNSPRSCSDLTAVYTRPGDHLTVTWTVDASGLDANWTDGSRYEHMTVNRQYIGPWVSITTGGAPSTGYDRLCHHAGVGDPSTPTTACSGVFTMDHGGNSSGPQAWDFSCGASDWYYTTVCRAYVRVFDSTGAELDPYSSGATASVAPSSPPGTPDPLASASPDPTPPAPGGGGNGGGVDICNSHPGISACATWPPPPPGFDLCAAHPSVLACATMPSANPSPSAGQGIPGSGGQVNGSPCASSNPATKPGYIPYDTVGLGAASNPLEGIGNLVGSVPAAIGNGLKWFWNTGDNAVIPNADCMAAVFQDVPTRLSSYAPIGYVFQAAGQLGAVAAGGVAGAAFAPAADFQVAGHSVHLAIPDLSTVAGVGAVRTMALFVLVLGALYALWGLGAGAIGAPAPGGDE